MGDQETDICAIHSFERNRYFRGKLLTVRDLEAEQDYFRGKSALVNRLIHGGGIVCGLEVKDIRIESNALHFTVDPGIALDYFGREIVVPQATSCEEENISPAVHYIYLKHKESLEEKSPVVENVSAHKEVYEYNRIKETYEIEVSVESPQLGELHICQLWIEGQSVESNSIKMERSMPKWVNTNEVFEVRIVITNNSSDPANIVVQEELNGLLEVEGLEVNSKIAFQDIAANGGTAEKSYLVKAGSELGSYTIKGYFDTSEILESIVEVIEGSISERIAEEYFSVKLKQCPGCSDDARVLLGAIDITETEANLNEAQSLRYRSIVHGNPMLYGLLSCIEKRRGPQGPRGPVGPQGIEGPEGPSGRPTGREAWAILVKLAREAIGEQIVLSYKLQDLFVVDELFNIDQRDIAELRNGLVNVREALRPKSDLPSENDLIDLVNGAMPFMEDVADSEDDVFGELDEAIELVLPRSDINEWRNLIEKFEDYVSDFESIPEQDKYIYAWTIIRCKQDITFCTKRFAALTESRRQEPISKLLDDLGIPAGEIIDELASIAIRNIWELARSNPEFVAKKTEIGEDTAEDLIEAAKERLGID